ncbi:MAG: transporter, cpa2 family protein [Chitinophagaceae bacterium]|nr:transporter, cpa2 family protein [Chitinophagaceae bacterium]
MSDKLHFTFPLENPVLIFSLVLFIILFAPIILSRLRIPHIIGLILAGAIIGPHGVKLMLRDSSIQLFGTVGLLYIMFLAGLEIDMADFKKNKYKSILFGLFTFSIPMTLGTLVSYYVLDYSILSSVLLASMFASHTLIAYPIVSKFGVIKNRAVNIAVGGTMITDTLTLLVLAIVVGIVKEGVGQEFWITLGVSLSIFAFIILVLIPIGARWFFRQQQDSVSEYIFVLGVVFFSGFLAELAGVEPIIGAFLAGLALNKLIPHTSALMNRIEFVGNALFIPFFLIGVGMLVDFKIFTAGKEALLIAGIMSVVAILSKFIATYLAKMSFRFTKDEFYMMFGLSSAHAAATLAAVLVGYNIIIGTTASGEPIRLLNENVLNGSIVMILITCTVSSFVVTRAARKIADAEKEEEPKTDEHKIINRFLIPVADEDTIQGVVAFSALLNTKKNPSEFFVLNIRTEEEDNEKTGLKLLELTQKAAAAINLEMTAISRYDANIPNGIIHSVKENNISDIFLSVNPTKGFTSAKFNDIIDQVAAKTDDTIFVYKAAQPINTIKKIIVAIPPKSEYEIGFIKYLQRLQVLSKELNATMIFYTNKVSCTRVKKVLENSGHNLPVSYELMESWSDFLIISKSLASDDLLVVITARKNTLSYNKTMDKLFKQLVQYFRPNNVLILYPKQYNETELERKRMDGSIDDLIEENLKRIDTIGKYFKKMIKRK